MNEDAQWEYSDGSKEMAGVCEYNANEQTDKSHEDTAMNCLDEAFLTNGPSNGDDHFLTTEFQPMLKVAESGFTKPFEPRYDDSDTTQLTYWSVNENNPADCGINRVLTGEIPWTVFNLGGAGGVVRRDAFRNVAEEGM